MTAQTHSITGETHICMTNFISTGQSIVMAVIKSEQNALGTWVGVINLYGRIREQRS